uniref:Uncharacterized protein n=1 Tax=Heliothis virescens TaxID=7102 RepID=A0A2A4JKD6_HELVI
MAMELFQGLDNVCPLYEQKVHEYKLMKNGSMYTNDRLKNAWKHLVHNVETIKRQPYQFHHLNDFHFINYTVRYNPSQTISNRPTYRFNLKSGPGVDTYGQVPIPSDQMIFRD